MYSRTFSGRADHLPPHYGGTALREEARCEPPPPPCESEQAQSDAPHAPCPPPKGEGLLPYGLSLEDLLLLGLAVLLWLDGCEDDYLPLLLIFLLVVH